VLDNPVRATGTPPLTLDASPNKLKRPWLQQPNNAFALEVALPSKLLAKIGDMIHAKVLVDPRPLRVKKDTTAGRALIGFITTALRHGVGI
jgi:hypothetical protein